MKCKTEFKKRGNKIVLIKEGFCDDRNPNVMIKKEIDFLDIDKLEEA